MLNNQTIAFIFRLINFGVIIAVFVYIFQKKLLPLIKEKIQNKKNYFKELMLDCSDIQKKSDQVDKEIYDQEILSQDLISKIKKWKLSFDGQETKQLAAIHLIKKETDRKYEIKQKNITLKKIHKDLFPKIMNNLEKKVKEEFKSEDHINNYQQELIDFLKKADK